VDHRFRLQDTWLGCNGVIALFAIAVAAALAALVALSYALRSVEDARNAP
jgi:hypothetical protein